MVNSKAGPGHSPFIPHPTRNNMEQEGSNENARQKTPVLGVLSLAFLSQLLGYDDNEHKYANSLVHMFCYQ